MRLTFGLVFPLVTAVTAASGAASSADGSPGNGKPNIIMIMADDLGRDNLGFFNNRATHTPAIDRLLSDGLFLDSFHTFKVCAPSRASTMTGRYPFNAGFYDMAQGENQCTENYTALPALLKDQGYHTHALGKWDVGYVTKECTPTYRGFDTFLGYYKACNADLWYHINPGFLCPNETGFEFDFSDNKAELIGGSKGTNGTYSTRLFTHRAVDIINQHDKDTPLYMYIAPQNVHLACSSHKTTDGIQAPCETLSFYQDIVNDTMKLQSAVTTELDFLVGNVTDTLKKNGMWNNTVLSFASDNGGPLDHTTNYPLRGGKHTFWDGGVRVVAFISGPALHLDPSRKGTAYGGIMHSADWYATFVEGAAGGVIPNTTGPMPPDSINLWDALAGDGSTDAPVRHEVIHQVQNQHFSENCSAIRIDDLKWVIGNVGDERTLRWPKPESGPVPFGHTGGHVEPGTDHCRVGPNVADKVITPRCKQGCLFNITADPAETVDLASDPKYEDAIKALRTRLQAAADAAPPKSAYFPQIEYKAAHEEICTNLVKTQFLEPMRLKD